MSVILATGDIKRDYEIVDLVFAMAVHKAGFFESSANPGKAFEGIREQLKAIAIKLVTMSQYMRVQTGMTYS